MIWTILGLLAGGFIVYVGYAFIRGYTQGGQVTRVNSTGKGFLGQCKDLYDRMKTSLFTHKDCD